MKTLLSTPRKLIVAFAVLVAAIALASCSTDSATPATPVAPTAAAYDLGSSGPSLTTASPDDALAQWKDREKARVKAEADRSVSVYDSLHGLWQAAHAKKRHGHPNTATTVADCEPLPYAADVQIVGPEGALFNVGPHKFFIPRGALKEKTVITVELPVSEHAELSFSPHGLHFGSSYLMLDYHKCELANSKYRDVVYTDDDYNILEKPTSYDQKNASSVWAAINHFSHYVVAY
ncbi:MAG TPA: hypothetical protein VF761_01620 [Gemmatimonadaceae bacterium]